MLKQEEEIMADTKRTIRKNTTSGQNLAEMIELVYVPGGCFEMGDFTGDGGKSVQPVQTVRVEDFSIGKYLVTHGQWESVMGENPSHFQLGKNHPVESVSWVEAQRFIDRLNQLTGKRYRLPTEAEWEYAARSGGKKEEWAGTSDTRQIENFGWFLENSKALTHAVGQKEPNGLGIYDMSGNVWEWCRDLDDYDRHSHVASLPEFSQEDLMLDRMIRGGSWYHVSCFAQTMCRHAVCSAYSFEYLGLRLVLDQ